MSSPTPEPGAPEPGTPGPGTPGPGAAEPRAPEPGAPEPRAFEGDLGPLDYLVVEFPDGVVGAGGLAAVLELAGRGQIRILDIEFFGKDASGAVGEVDVATAVPGHEEFADLAGANTHLFTGDDRARIEELLHPGAVAIAIVYEEQSLFHAVHSWEGEGGSVVADGPVSPDDLAEALGVGTAHPEEQS